MPVTVDPSDRALFYAAARKVCPFNERALAAAAPKLSARSLLKGEAFLRAADRAHEVAVVVSGLLREHFLLPDGTERTKAFIEPGAFSGSLADLISGRPSRAWIVAEQPSRLLTLPAKEVVTLARSHASWARFRIRATEALLLLKAEREYELLGLDAAARYAAFQRRYPGLEAMVAARHVASYLGITPVHLSRLRRLRTLEARAQARAR
jgi:CRP-like cAMP-binding protein